MRIEKIYNCLKKEAGEQGISTLRIAQLTGVGRANVSSDLNKLVAAGRVRKSRGKPVLYFPLEPRGPIDAETDAFSRFADPSLHAAIAQAKAAVLYPPAGMNVLISGETGVGKSLFAELMYDYARAVHQLPAAAPFIIFNCADYASNPQLLSGQLFGSKKGAYTGSTENRIGLLEQADGGVLFLDEVHRLPPEGQEMFFTFIDKGFFRRVGETDSERRVKVRIFASTTEEPEESLLRTFTRRFPMVLRLPALRERSCQARFDLIRRLFNHEAAHLKQNITVSINALRALLSYDYPGNIGQLKSDIHFACAGAYAEYISGKAKRVYLCSRMLPAHSRSALFDAIGHRQLWPVIAGINKQSITFTGRDEPILFNENRTEDIYDLIALRVSELKSMGMDNAVVEEEIESEIAGYLQTYLAETARRFDSRKLANLVSARVLNLTEEIISYAGHMLQKSFDNKIYYGLATHIEKAVARLRQNKHIVNPQLNRIRTAHKAVFNIALDCLRMIERVMEITLPVDEAGFLAMFFLYSESEFGQPRSAGVTVLVVAHGSRTASAIVETANELLGTDYALAFNVPLEVKAQTVLEDIVSYINGLPEQADILLLVDMGSLTAFGAAIEARCEVNVRALQLVSTLHVIEAVQHAMNGCSLDDIYRSVLNVNLEFEQAICHHALQPAVAEPTIPVNKLALITVCTTGEGTAKVVENLLTTVLAHRKNIIDIISLSLTDEQDIYRQIRQLTQTVVAIISPFPLQTPILQFDLADVLHRQGLNKLQEIIDTEATWVMLEGTVRQMLRYLQPADFLAYVRVFTANIGEALTFHFSGNRLIGLTLHLASLFERYREGAVGHDFPEKEDYMREHSAAIALIRQHLEPLEQAFAVRLADDELCSLHRFFLLA
ncbi:sigma 54-interacting transcriptional regulator [Kalamiella sp. sgz302252]|uniref:sigma 54-interacting transcriptional regulator n=1 Tax=Pantoea sp. sgz302252 TaxID=3341827 RepID=UPI0036D2CC56